MKIWIIRDTRFLEDQEEVNREINWSALYPDYVKNIPFDMPYPKFKTIRIINFVD